RHRRLFARRDFHQRQRRRGDRRQGRERTREHRRLGRRQGGWTRGEGGARIHRGIGRCHGVGERTAQRERHGLGRRALLRGTRAAAVGARYRLRAAREGLAFMIGWFRARPRDPRHAIDAELWKRATASWLFMRGLDAGESEKLRGPAERCLGRQHFSGTYGLDVTEAMRVEVAAQAAILVLELGIEWYDGWSEVIVYPAQFAPEREYTDEAGVVHLTQDPMAGEAWLGGPVLLSYEDVAMTADEEMRVAGYNVVIHEFAHKLDMRNGDSNGFPPLHSGMSPREWRLAFAAAFEDFGKRVDAAERLPRRKSQEALDALPIDPYAAESPGEFFAVASEAFFETPELLAPAYPEV